MSNTAISTLAALALILAIAGCSLINGARTSGQRASYTETIGDTGVRFEMAWVTAGNFWIGRTEVTWDEYLLFCAFDDESSEQVDGITRPSKPLPDVAPFDRDWGTGKRPAVGMSWNAAQKYCEWLSIKTGKTYRLPTETEWRLACGRRPRPPLTDHAWFAGNSDEMTQEVALKTPNQLGLYDMLGNLWEYCRGPYDASQPDRAVLRGGSWATPAEELTPASRLGFEDGWVLDDPNVPPGVWWVPEGSQLGFRVLRASHDERR